MTNRFLTLMVGIGMLLGVSVSHALETERVEEINAESFQKSAVDYILDNYEVDQIKLDEINKSEHAEIMLAYFVEAIAGEAESQNALALFYQLGGDGIEKDHSEALKWYSKSAQQGNAVGQSAVGWAYFFW